MTRPLDSDSPEIEDFEPLAETDEEPSLPPLDFDSGDPDNLARFITTR